MIKAVVFDMYETLITHYGCPLYFSAQMASDAGVEMESFRRMWRESESDRSIGKIRFEEIIETILRTHGVFCRETAEKIYQKRVHTKELGFAHLHEQILPMLELLQGQRIQIGLISNCFSEEAEVIEHSILYPYFDAVCLSWREGVQKPDPVIFERMLEKLGCRADECLYVGDGGSHELEAAEACGMKPYQAVWYLQEGNPGQYARNRNYTQLEQPLDVMLLCKQEN